MVPLTSKLRARPAAGCDRPGQRPRFEPLDMDTHAVDLDALAKLVHRAIEPLRLHDPSSFVEIGSWTGRTALAILEAGAGCKPRIFCVDTWAGSADDRTEGLVAEHGEEKLFRTFCANVAPHLGTKIFPCRGPSLLWANVWQLPADLIFIDADHRYEAVRADIAAWAPHVRPGGILCGHDYGYMPGVTRAVDEFGKDGVQGTVWWKQL